MEKWNEICHLVNYHKKVNSDEKTFQNEIINIFEKLGWLRFNNEIISKQRIRIGSINTIEPDIVLRLNGENTFVIELKHPNFSSSQIHYEQIFSYMRQLKLDFGILIDESLHIYYDDPRDDKMPIKIYETRFIENNQEASDIIKLITKSSFDKEELRHFCERKLEEFDNINTVNEIIDLFEAKGENIMTNLLLKSLKTDYNDFIAKNVIDSIIIEIRRKSKKAIIAKHKRKDEEISIIDKQTSNTYTKKINKRTISEMKIGQFVQHCFRKAFEQNLITNDEIKKLQDPTYSKQIFNSNFEILRRQDQSIRDEHGRIRYYTREVFCNNFHLTSQWIEPQWDLLLNWLDKIEYDYTIC